jgi:D-alanine transaminase
MTGAALSPFLSPSIPPLPCYLGSGSQGQFTTVDKATVSVLDRGFIFGDGIYEVITVYGGKPFRFEPHMARLARSLSEVRIPNPFMLPQWLTLAEQLIAIESVALSADSIRANGQNDSKNYLIYLQITRGVALRDHAMPQGIAPTVFMMRSPLNLPVAQAREQGVSCVTADDFRWEKAHIKSTSLLGNVFARMISFDVGATETVMFRGDALSEGASSNVWVVKDGGVFGPPKDHRVLEGIRYGLIEEMCRACGLDFALRRITRQEVMEADELLLSSATKEVLPITQLDGRAVGSGKPGAVYAKLYAAYQAAKQAECGVSDRILAS